MEDRIDQFNHADAEQPVNEVRVVFLGDSDSGKTHTIARLLKSGAESGSKG